MAVHDDGFHQAVYIIFLVPVSLMESNSRKSYHFC